MMIRRYLVTEKPKLKRRRMLTDKRDDALQGALDHDGLIFIWGGWWPRLKHAGGIGDEVVSKSPAISSRTVSELCQAGFLVTNAWRRGVGPKHNALAMLTDHGRDPLSISLFLAGLIVTRDELRGLSADDRKHTAVFTDGLLSGTVIEPPAWLRAIKASWLPERRTWERLAIAPPPGMADGIEHDRIDQEEIEGARRGYSFG